MIWILSLDVYSSVFGLVMGHSAEMFGPPSLPGDGHMTVRGSCVEDLDSSAEGFIHLISL